jgi:hypothetical protein
MLLVLYREYVARVNAHPDIQHLLLDYAAWLKAVTEEAASEGITFGEFVRENIDPTYTGV